MVPNRSIGYTRFGGDELKPNADTLPYRGSSAGGGYSTVEDLLRFATALQTHKLLNAQYTDLLTTGKVETPVGSLRLRLRRRRCRWHALLRSRRRRPWHEWGATNLSWSRLRDRGVGKHGSARGDSCVKFCFESVAVEVREGRSLSGPRRMQVYTASA